MQSLVFFQLKSNYQQDNYIQILVLFAPLPMKNSVSSSISSDFHSLLRAQQDLHRRPLGRGWPARKFITKKEAPKNHKKKTDSKKLRHTTFYSDTNCHSMSMEETTQQGPSSSSDLKQAMDPQNRCLPSLGFSQLFKARNSNSESQRISELGEYLEPMSAHMHEKELQYVPKFIIDPNSVSDCNRTKLISWIFELNSRFLFRLETGFLATNIIDRALGVLRVSVDLLPLLGITALFMATKYEEIMIPHLNNFVAVVPDSYKVTKQTVLMLESRLLTLLSFDLGYSSPILFIHHFGLVTVIPDHVKERAIMIAKALIISSACRYWTSSKLAAHAIRTAQEDCQDTENSCSPRILASSTLKV